MATQTAYLAIQCTAPETGETGTFLWTGAQSHRDPAARLASPVFDSMYELRLWIKNRSRWIVTGRADAHSCGTYTRDLFSADACPSDHWNDGTDHCADCGAYLN